MKQIDLMELNDMAYHLNKLRKNDMAVFAVGPSETYYKLPVGVKDLIDRLKKEGRITTVVKKIGVRKNCYQVHDFEFIAVGLK